MLGPPNYLLPTTLEWSLRWKEERFKGEVTLEKEEEENFVIIVRLIHSRKELSLILS
jgi:hypothetical protein